jgi:hypothetical protein
VSSFIHQPHRSRRGGLKIHEGAIRCGGRTSDDISGWCTGSLCGGRKSRKRCICGASAVHFGAKSGARWSVDGGSLSSAGLVREQGGRSDRRPGNESPVDRLSLLRIERARAALRGIGPKCCGTCIPATTLIQRVDQNLYTCSQFSGNRCKSRACCNLRGNT